MPPISSFYSRRLVENPFFLLAGALLFDEKSRQSAALFWFGLRDVGFLKLFCSQAVIQRTIVDSPSFLGTVLAEKITFFAHTARLPKK
jgi:hypothetical protein